MANLVFRKARLRAFEKQLDITSGLKVLLVMTSSAVTANLGIEFLGDLSAGQLDENDGAGYTAGGVALTAVAWAEDPTADLVRLTADDVDFGSLSAGARAIKGAILYKDVTTYANSPVLGWIDTVDGGPPFPYALNGGPFKLLWPSSGIIEF